MMLAIGVPAMGAADSSPVRTWGDFSSTYRERDYGTLGSQADNWLNALTINASSYIWRPWFATARGALTLSLDEANFSDQPSEKNTYISGNAGAELFPRSRFPAQAYYSQSRNELDQDIRKRNIETTEFKLRQQYRTEDNAHSLRGEYVNNTREEAEVADVRGKRLLFASNNRIDDNILGFDLQADNIEDSFKREKSDSYAVTGRHSYYSDRNFSVENLASTSAVENDFIRSATDIETAEISSLLSWHPGTDQDLSVTGNLRLSDQVLRQTDDLTTPVDESGRSDFKTANLNQGLLYQYSDHLLLQQSINATQTETGNSTTRLYAEGVGFNYTPDRIDLDVGSYGWNFGSNYVHEHGDIETNNSLNNRFSHSLDRRRELGEGRSLRTSLTQSLTYNERQVGFDRQAIDHSFLVSWAQSTNVDQAVVSLQLLDARATEEEDELFQLANLQFTGVLRFDRFTQLSGNATLQWSRREDGDDESTDTVANGYLEYRRSRVFDVPRLLYRSRLALSQQKSETEQIVGEIIENEENSESWENSLEYAVGRLETSAGLDFVKVDGDYDRIFRIELTRYFGDL
jgi:hypothetical protein